MAADVRSASNPALAGAAPRFEVLGALAAGNLSMLYLARRVDPEARAALAESPLVVLKRPLAGVADDAQALRDFAREARFASRIASRYVVAASELAEDDSGAYFAMEYVAGPSLSRFQCVESEGTNVLTRVSTPVAVRIMLDLLAALDALHRAPDDAGAPLRLVHGDVSPANVLVGQDGCTKLADFGATHVAGTAAVAPTHGFGPAVAYASPEAIRGELLDASADVFGAGVIFWELCAGRRLFAAPTPQMVARQVLGGYIPDLRQTTPTLPPALASVCEGALARDKRARFPSAQAFARALERAMDDTFGVPRRQAVAHGVRQRCAGFLEERQRMIEHPDGVLRSGLRAKVSREA